MKTTRGRDQKSERNPRGGFSREERTGRRPGGQRGESGESLKKIYEADLQDMYWAEKHLISALPKMAKAAESQELRKAFEDHLEKTRTHVTRLEQVFSSSGLKTEAKRCEGIEGITEEGEQVIEEHERGSVRDSGLIIAAQKVEHYEIASYGSLRTLAQVMGLQEAAQSLQQTLDEESAADEQLSQIAESINEKAFREPETVSET